MAFILACLFSLEQLFSNVASLYKRSGHLLGNLVLQAGYILFNLGLATVVVDIINWVDVHQIGLLNLMHMPFWVKLILGVLCIDLTNYWSHRLAHTWELFWRLHRVHHSDTIMDSSTTYRFHPLDALLDNAASVTAVLIFGLDGSILIFWLILYMPLLVLHHTNFIMPKWFDKSFGQIIVSPNFHKIHHHQEQVYTDSNYGLLFIFWDKLFKTFQRIPVSTIQYGLSEFDKPERQTCWYLLKSPFINPKK